MDKDARSFKHFFEIVCFELFDQRSARNGEACFAAVIFKIRQQHSRLRKLELDDIVPDCVY